MTIIKNTVMDVLRYNFVYTSQVRFQMHFLPEQFVAKRTIKLRRYVVAAHHVTLQMMFELESSCAFLASELWLHSALVLQMTGQRMFIFVATTAFLWTRPLEVGRMT